jgi:hypothetical protein
MMRLIRILMLAALSAAPLAAQAKPDSAKIDITGTWTFTVESPAGTGTPTVEFKQKGDSISGTYKSVALGTRTFTGTLKAGKIEFSFPAESGGQQFVMAFSGTMLSPTSMKGSIDFSGMATGSFDGGKKP